ncbi:MAG: hypothetical protein IJ723_02000 [Ruminococcus sp.]|nr:hypothetical protein [Ruminococcus sp.]
MLCPKCQKEISDLVIECPYCHTSIRMSDKKKKKLAEKQRRRLADNRRKKDKTIKVKALPEDGGKKRKASQLNV